MKNFSIVVAMDKNRGIGKNGRLPWHLPSDLKYFRDLTVKAQDGKRNAVVMGRVTWESIPEKFRPLPERLNVVLTRNVDYSLPQGCLRAGGLEEAFNLLDQKQDVDKIFVVGGASVYKQAMGLSHCADLYVTRIAEGFDCDAVFPEIPLSFEKISENGKFSENNCHFSFQVYTKEKT